MLWNIVGNELRRHSLTTCQGILCLECAQKEERVDSGIFYAWCTHFFKHVMDLTTSNNRNFHLILDGYRCHMSVRTLEMHNTHGVIV